MDTDMRSLLPTLVLGSIFIAAMRSDLMERRIPNRLVLVGLLVGLTLQAVITPGQGLFNSSFGALGLADASAGALLGLALLLPMYALGALGAGDVKFMAVIGSFLGPSDILGATAFTLLAGGVLAAGVAVVQGRFKRVMSNVRLIIFGFVMRAIAGQELAVDAPAQQTGKLPYAIAICTGTITYLVLTKLASWKLW